MWQYSIQKKGRDTSVFKIFQNEIAITYSEAIELLRFSKEFRLFFIELLRTSSFDAYFWEVRPVASETTNEDFEFALIDSPALSKITADRSLFIKYFDQNEFVTSFLNLNGDAKLIVPVEISDINNYNHIATFVRNAPIDQIDIFWKRVGEEIHAAIGKKEKWLSTSGLGVHWLHVRIDERPKYYNYLPYKQMN